MEKQAEPERKKPGRPKKKAVTVPVETHGIRAEPSDPTNVLELVYHNPSLFKKLMQLYKAFGVSELDLDFTTTGLKIFMKDHLGKSDIYTSIEGHYMNLYYCKQPVRICVKRENLERVLSNLSKNHYSISFILKEENFRSMLYIAVSDVEYDNDNSYEIDVSYKVEDIAAVKNDETNYPIKFKVTSRHFKATINSIKKLSKTFCIQKSGNEALQLCYDKVQKVGWTSVYNNNEKIELKSTLGPEETFNVSIYIDYIQPFSNSNIGEDVYIAADKQQKICFSTFLDKKENGFAAAIKIFTEIKDYRRGRE